jgi:hypothetical protein
MLRAQKRANSTFVLILSRFSPDKIEALLPTKY